MYVKHKKKNVLVCWLKSRATLCTATIQKPQKIKFYTIGCSVFFSYDTYSPAHLVSLMQVPLAYNTNFLIDHVI